MLKKSEKIVDLFLKIQLLIVLLYNTGIIIVFPYKVPVEFSTLSYFVVPFIVLLNVKELRIWAAYTALLSGAGYYISMVLYGNDLFGHFPVYSVVTSLFNHGSLLAYSIIVILTYNIKKRDKYILLGGVFFNIVWALSLRQFVLHPGRIFIYEILDAYLVKAYFPNSNFTGVIIYFIIVFSLLFLSMKLVYVANHIYKQKVLIKTK
jgi:hypothetical protein